MMSLMQENSITLLMPTNKDFYDDKGLLVRGRKEEKKIIGSLQPLRDLTQKIVRPQGTLATGAYKFFTCDDVSFLNQATKFSSPTCFIDGQEYVVYTEGDWSRTKLSTAHTLIYLFLKEQGRK